MQAGASVVALPIAPGMPMMGYGLREGAARSTHDALHARALYLAGARPLLWIACEVCLIVPRQADQVRVAVARETGLAPDCITVACIHTHSGPETGLLALVAGVPEPPHVAPLLAAAVEAGVRAVRSAEPARLGVGHGEAHIGRNRRSASGPLDPDILVLRVDRADGSPLAVWYAHGCHPTVLGHENLAFSADWPWAANARIEAALPGAVPIFALGAHADIDPRTRGLMELGRFGQSLGAGFDQVEQLGREVGDAVAAAASSLATRAEQRIGCASARVRIDAHRATDAERRAALAALELPEDSEIGTGDFFKLERERTQEFPPAERRERLARVRGYLRGRTAARFAFSEHPDVEVQLLRVGDARIAALPAEATTDVGLDWKQRRGSRDAAVASIANGWLRYLPHPANFAEPGAEESYEVLMSTLVPEAATRLLDAAQQLDAELAAEVGA